MEFVPREGRLNFMASQPEVGSGPSRGVAALGADALAAFDRVVPLRLVSRDNPDRPDPQTNGSGHVEGIGGDPTGVKPDGQGRPSPNGGPDTKPEQALQLGGDPNNGNHQEETGEEDLGGPWPVEDDPSRRN